MRAGLPKFIICRTTWHNPPAGCSFHAKEKLRSSSTSSTTSLAPRHNRSSRFRSAVRPHPPRTQRGRARLTELTVSYWGYSTQIHRPFAIGKEPAPIYRKLFDAALECYENIRKICRPGTASEQIIAASSIIEESGFTSYDSVFHGEAGKSPELGSKSAAHPLEPWTLLENMVHVIQPNPVTKDFKAGLQLGAAVVVKPNGGEPLHNYPFKFPVCG
ncbi:MAG TPA: M24 family metallopeptidase [Candidatus Binatia bacterium]